MKLRKLTDAGRAEFLTWLDSRKLQDSPPESLLEGEGSEDALSAVDVDLSKVFSNRYEFGKYVVELVGAAGIRDLLAQANDGVWDWLTVAYFAQFGKKASKPWHYTVTRSGHAGSLAYRHLARTSVEMYWRHKELSLVMLAADMSTWGDMSEQLTSRQDVAYHRGYIQAANELYLQNGVVRRGAAARVPPKSKRKAGDARGKGGVGRLALAVRRLCRTYDTHVVPPSDMITLLPKEFAAFSRRTNSA